MPTPQLILGAQVALQTCDTCTSHAEALAGNIVIMIDGCAWLLFWLPHFLISVHTEGNVCFHFFRRSHVACFVLTTMCTGDCCRPMA
jgi:hypothetical protein